MNKQDWADRFSCDVDRLLAEAGRSDWEPTPTEYRQALDMARTLATADWSAESRVRGTLRRRLLDKIEARGVGSLQKENSMRTIFGRQHPVLSLAALGLVALLVIALAWPGALIAAAQGIGNVVQSLMVGQYTSIHQVAPDQSAPADEPPATPVVEQRDDLWIVRTATGNYGGNVLPGHEVAVRSVPTLDEAQAGAPFTLRQPEYLPAGYAFREAMLTPSDWVLLFYDGPGGEVVLVQMPIGVISSSDSEVVASAVGTLTDSPIVSATLNGRLAGWVVEENTLMWEADGISYELGGKGLSLDEATRIAESLK